MAGKLNKGDVVGTSVQVFQRTKSPKKKVFISSSRIPEKVANKAKDKQTSPVQVATQGLNNAVRKAQKDGKLISK